MNDKFNCVQIETQRLVLNGFSESDFEELFEIALSLNESACEKKCMPFVAFYKGLSGKQDCQKTKENTQIYLNRVLGKVDTSEDKWMHCFAVRDKNTNKLMGMVGFVFFRDTEDEKVMHRDLGYFIAPSFQRKGYVREAVEALCEHFFKQFDSLEATTHPDNIASASLLKKLGCKEIGLEKESKYGGEPRLKVLLTKDDFYRR